MKVYRRVSDAIFDIFLLSMTYRYADKNYIIFVAFGFLSGLSVSKVCFFLFCFVIQYSIISDTVRKKEELSRKRVVDFFA